MADESKATQAAGNDTGGKGTRESIKAKLDSGAKDDPGSTGAHAGWSDLVPAHADPTNPDNSLSLAERLRKNVEDKKATRQPNSAPDQGTLSDDELNEAESTQSAQKFVRNEDGTYSPVEEPAGDGGAGQSAGDSGDAGTDKPTQGSDGTGDGSTEGDAGEGVPGESGKSEFEVGEEYRRSLEEMATNALRNARGGQSGDMDLGQVLGTAPSQDTPISGKMINGKFVPDDPAQAPQATTSTPHQEQTGFISGVRETADQKQTGKTLNLTDEVYQNILQDREAFGGFMNQVANLILDRLQQESLPKMHTTLDKTVNNKMQNFMTVHAFYADNPDLKQYKNMLSLTAAKVQADNPGRDINWILSETEKKVRQDLKLVKDAKGGGNQSSNAGGGTRRNGAAFAGGGSKGRAHNPGGGRRSGNPVRNELAEMDTEGKFFK